MAFLLRSIPEVCSISGRAVVQRRPIASLAPVARRQLACNNALQTRSTVDFEDKYAVIDFNGAHEWVEEGAVFACDKRQLDEITLGNTIKFKNIVALKEGGDLALGKPYLRHAVVEGRIEDEFRGPSMYRAGDVPQLTLRKVLITRISSGESA